MDNYKLKLIRKLKFKCKELREELAETHAIYEAAIPAFCQHVCDFCKGTGTRSPLDEFAAPKQPSPSETREAYIAATLTDEQKKQLPSQFKKVFSNIVIQTHPDKTHNEDGRDLYEQAVQAKKENKVSELVSIAQDLKINISHLSYSAIREIEAQINKTYEEIDLIRRSYPWHWHYAPPQKKEKIIQQFCERR